MEVLSARQFPLTRMKPQIWMALGWLWLVSGSQQLCAQVKARLVLEQDQFLVGEELQVAVKVTNRSGQTLHLGEEPDWLTFSIEAVDGTIVVKNGEAPVTGAFALASGQVATRRVNLEPYFDIHRVGRYRVKARVNIKAWDHTIATEAESFDIIKGARLWTQAFGMSLPEGVTNQPPEIRRYYLEQANHLRGQLRLYLRVTDAADSQVIKVLPIGSMVSFSNPDCQIDRLNNLHILYQKGAQTYLYTMVSPAGDLLIRQTHEITTTRPKLRADEDGNFSVVGGARRLSPDDVPAPADPSSETNAPPQP